MPSSSPTVAPVSTSAASLTSPTSLLSAKRRLLALLRINETLSEALKREQKKLAKLEQDKYFLAERTLGRNDALAQELLKEAEDQERTEDHSKDKRKSLLKAKEPPRQKRKYKKRKPKVDQDTPSAGASPTKAHTASDEESDALLLSGGSVSFSSAFSRAKTSMTSIRRPYQMGVNRQPKGAPRLPVTLAPLQVPSFPHPPSGEVPGNLFEEEVEEYDDDDDLDDDEELEEDYEDEDVDIGHQAVNVVNEDDDGLDLEEELLEEDDEDMEDDDDDDDEEGEEDEEELKIDED